jgi:hypothetical protein
MLKWRWEGGNGPFVGLAAWQRRGAIPRSIVILAFDRWVGIATLPWADQTGESPVTLRHVGEQQQRRDGFRGYRMLDAGSIPVWSRPRPLPQSIPNRGRPVRLRVGGYAADPNLRPE